MNVENWTEALTPRQIQAIRALLSERNRTAAAAKVGISRVTLWRWLKQPSFREAVIAGKRAQLEALRADIRARRL